MNLVFNPKKKIYIDLKSEDVFKTILVVHNKVVESINVTNPRTGHLKHKDIVELKNIGPLYEFKMDFNNNVIEKYKVYNDKRVGFDRKGFDEIYKIAEAILKDDSFIDVISKAFLINILFEWFIEKYEERDVCLLSDYVLNKSLASIISYNIFCPILYLESDKEFNFGDVNFKYISEEYVEALSEGVDQSQRSDYKSLLLQHKGQLMACYYVKAEKNKAIELAVEQIKMCIDALRIISPTVEDPTFEIFYDIDLRNIHQQKGQVLVQLVDDEKQFYLTIIKMPRPFVITPLVWSILVQSGIKVLDEFIKRKKQGESELEGLLKNAIQNYSKALANHDLHLRVTQVFTVLESLLLPDDSSPIVDSVAKYLPKLVTNDISLRLEIIDVVKDMYKVRSMMMHHAKRRKFDNNNLATLQISTRTLIIGLVLQSKSKNNKKDILREIDDAINKA